MQFAEPVSIFVGLSFPRSIAGAADAHAFLCEWPHSKRDEAHEAARAACHGALAGVGQVERARARFAAFARRHRILAPKMGGVVAARATGALPGRAAMPGAAKRP